jgi:hypothetical protein
MSYPKDNPRSGSEATIHEGCATEFERVAEGPFLVGQSGETEYGMEACGAPKAVITSDAVRRRASKSPIIAEGRPRLESSEPDRYMAIRPALSPAHAHLSADEIATRFGRLPAIIALHQALASPEPQHAALAVLLGNAGRRSTRVDGLNVAIPTYLRLLSRLCREAAEEAEAGPGSLSEAAPPHAGPTSTTPAAIGETAPSVGVPRLDESQLKKWIERALDGAHVIGSASEVIEYFHASTAWPAIEAALSWGDSALAAGAAAAGEAGALALIGSIAAPLGYAALIATTVLALHEAFSTGTRIQKKKGYCYGIMWEALKMPSVNRTFQPWGSDTAEELRAAWDDGVKKGRAAFQSDVKLHNQVLLRIGYEQMTQNRHGWTRPEDRMLNLLWEQVRDGDLPGTHLGWMIFAPDLGAEYDEKLDDDLPKTNQSPSRGSPRTSSETTPSEPTLEAQVADPAPSPFPARFVEPHASSLAARNKMIAAFHTAVQAVAADPTYDVLPSIDTLPIAIVALDHDGSRPLAGQRHFEMYYSASLLKVAAMYAAFQLRAAANDLAARLDSVAVSEGQLFKRLTDIFDPQISGAVPRINNHKPPISLAMRVPKYRDIFAATTDHGHWRLDFNTAFNNNLSAMIVDSDDIAAGVCIRALGYSWIDGVLQSAGFFDDSLPRRAGIWLAGDYNLWPTVDVDSLNDGTVKQATTCFHMAWLFVRLFDNGLVDDASHHFAGNSDMQHLLALAVDSHGAPSLLKRVFAPGSPPFHVLQTKIGVGELKGGDCRGSDAAGRDRRDRCVYSEASIVQDPVSGRKFVTMWQNLTFLKAHPDWWELGLRRICGIIRKTMDNYHP